jgi:hypothetical protein
MVKNPKDFARPHSGSNIGNRHHSDCDPTPLGGRTHYCRNIVIELISNTDLKENNDPDSCYRGIW